MKVKGIQHIPLPLSLPPHHKFKGKEGIYRKKKKRLSIIENNLFELKYLSLVLFLVMKLSLEILVYCGKTEEAKHCVCLSFCLSVCLSVCAYVCVMLY